MINQEFLGHGVAYFQTSLELTIFVNWGTLGVIEMQTGSLASHRQVKLLRIISWWAQLQRPLLGRFASWLTVRVLPLLGWGRRICKVGLHGSNAHVGLSENRMPIDAMIRYNPMIYHHCGHFGAHFTAFQMDDAHCLKSQRIKQCWRCMAGSSTTI
jgi:hypothetical protein